MGTRSFAQVAPTAATIALNAYIFGYGGHSLVTPHHALKQLWWTDERIKAKVTRSFVVSKLRGEEREFLDRPLAFGEGLTDDTYMEWILERAKRFFLILAEVGVPDQIFGCIDDSWDDDDLPIPLESIPSLELAYENDDALNKKFYDAQFLYLLRELQEGTQIDYGPREHIPMEYVNTIPPAVNLQIWDRVHFPGKSDEVYMRRKYALNDKDSGRDYRDSFMHDIRKAQRLPHEHIARVWASYTTENSGYIISDFVGEHNLGTFIDHRMPAQFQRVAAAERPVLLCEWMHCLSDALASLHHRGVAHSAIRPSNILISRANHIAFADIGSLRTFQRGKKGKKVEAYDYAAPESHLSSPTMLASSPPTSSIGAFNKLRKLSSSTSSSSGGSSTGSSTRTNSFCTIATSPTTPSFTDRSNSMTTIMTTISPIQKSSGSFRNFSRHLTHQVSSSSSDSTMSSTKPTRVFPKPTIVHPGTLRDLPEPSPQMSDIYSLACIFLDMVTFMVKGKTNDFVKSRTTRVTSASSGNKRTRIDTSFHSDPDKIEAWMTVLIDECDRRTEQVFKGMPELLRLIRKMMNQNATLRPTAIEVRDQLKVVLIDFCGIQSLCCADRTWDVPRSTNVDRDSRRVSEGAPSSASTADRNSKGEPKIGAWRRAFSRSS